MNARTAPRGTGEALTVKEYQRWEVANWILQHETPGRFGTFTSSQVAE
jgi:hypothetical protein